MMTQEEHDRLYGRPEPPKDTLTEFLEGLASKVPDPRPAVRLTRVRGNPVVEFGVRWSF